MCWICVHDVYNVWRLKSFVNVYDNTLLSLRVCVCVCVCVCDCVRVCVY